MSNLKCKHKDCVYLLTEGETCWFCNQSDSYDLPGKNFFDPISNHVKKECWYGCIFYEDGECNFEPDVSPRDVMHGMYECPLKEKARLLDNEKQVVEQSAIL